MTLPGRYRHRVHRRRWAWAALAATAVCAVTGRLPVSPTYPLLALGVATCCGIQWRYEAGWCDGADSTPPPPRMTSPLPGVDAALDVVDRAQPRTGRWR